ncbi:ABC transporter ATP-binding protein [Streptantibioticus ferralitis]|uniref:ATP-binding cassette domain-containing protein n=1 Tax=Streptantibioticus ferralitis TaxID=236510 RepID=A0ABT5ZAY5_9ACTN|nr:ATP-binding cassette domain-containing protein [Streptantibioticus ferralitis]MDF2260838.1 ATP-binding cassette domain-containing protein [Streptantibioticus ferralitis]
MTPTSEPVVQATGVGIHIPDGPVLLNETSLVLRRGQITALTGPSGSGKTTLLRALVGALPAGAHLTAGTIRVLDHDIFALPADELRQLRRHHITYVGQDPASALNPRMRVRRLVSEVAADPAPQALRDLLVECRLPVDEGLLDRRPTALSGGQQRRVALVRALARKPDVLLLDEPTAGLDAALRDDIADLLRHLADRRHLAIVIACHDPELVARCADEVIALDGHTPTPAVEKAHQPAQPTGAAALVATGIRVTFTQRRTPHPALADIDFTATPGSATGIVGPSGSGKTTLLRVLAGLQCPDTGTLTLDGQPLPTAARKRTRDHQRRIQLIPQNPLGALNPARTIGAALARPLQLHRTVPKAQVPDRVAELLHHVGLPAEFARRYPHQLSGGQRQRVSIARALAPEPNILLCDEVTSALDPDTATAIMELLTRLRTERGLTIALVSHELQLIAAYTDTIHILAAGRLVDTGPTRSLLPTTQPTATHRR